MCCIYELNKAIGFKTGDYMMITLKEAHYSITIAKALAKIPEIIERNYVSGKYALFIKIVAEDNEHHRKVVYEKVYHIKAAGSADTFISFGAEFKRNPPIRIRE
jgi:Lrp/AsnC family transcriptional regulator for asnA, asnC and gidA